MTLQKQTHHQNHHVPVLLEQTLELLHPETDESYLDLTAGYGGHAKAVLERTKAPQKAVLVDRDQNAVKALQPLADHGVTLMQADFDAASEKLLEQKRRFDLILMDVGVSSPHLDNPERGFSFQQSGPLDMRMDQTQDLTAAELVNGLPENELADLIYKYGEEPRSRKIAAAIVASRPLETTTQLANVIESKAPRRGKTHPATRTFQALRIAVNDELEQLERTLERVPGLLTEDGRVAIISFHSLEDRLVKDFLKTEAEAGYEARLRVLTKKPVTGAQESVHKPRSRSAKLRAAVKINTQ